MSGGMEDAARGDQIEAPPARRSITQGGNDSVSRTELNTILKATTDSILVAIQQQIGAAFANANKSLPNIPNLDNDADTHATATTSKSTPSRTSTASSTSYASRTANGVTANTHANEDATAARAKIMRKEQALKSTLYEVMEDDTSGPADTNGPFGIPVGKRCELPSDYESQAVEFHTYVSHIIKADPDAEITAVAVADIAVKCITAMNPTFKIEVIRAVERAPIEGPKGKNNTKLHGYFVLKLASHPHLSPEQRSQLLRDIILDFVTRETQKTLNLDSDIPKYAGAIVFSLAPVNSDEWMPLGFIGGLLPECIDDFDAILKERIIQTMIEEANICMTCEDGSVTNEEFTSAHFVRQNLGILLYTTSTVLTNGRNSKAIAIGYAKTETGEAAAKVFADACEGKTLNVCGGIPATSMRFPSRHQRSKKARDDPIRSFVKDHITKNQSNCNKHYRLFDIENVTDAAYDEDLIDNITSTCNHIVGILPRLMKGEPEKDTLHKLKITLVVHKIGAVILKNGDYFRRILRTNFPKLFPAVSSVQDLKPQAKKSTPKPASQAVVNKPNGDWLQNIDRGFDNLQARSSGGYFVYGWGKGGRASVGYTLNWYGPGGGLERTNRVSGAIVRKVEKKAEVFELLNDWYGITNDEELAIFHRNIPHTESNLSPTWSLKFMTMPHRYGAKAYTFVDYDTDEILDYRIKATMYYTGSPDGTITHRNQLSKPPPTYEDESSDDEDNESEGNISDEDEDDNQGNDDEDDDPVSNSQAFFGMSDSNGKRRRLRTPTPSPKSDPFSNDNWAVVLNPSIITTVNDLSLHAKEFPSSDKITAIEFVATTDKWKEPDRALMAVFTVDQASAESYAHWVEHRAKLIFNVPVSTDVLSPMVKRSLSKLEQNWHEETMATSELTQYVKEELPIQYHGEFKKYIMWANKPAALAKKLLTDWKTTERIKEANTRRASPKSAVDFDANMIDADGATTQATANTSLAVAAAALATNPNANALPPPNADNAATNSSSEEEDDASIDLLIDAETDLLP
eukprot:scaffold42280_cov23-Cyclotella_meneghiniana.AAC.1